MIFSVSFRRPLKDNSDAVMREVTIEEAQRFADFLIEHMEREYANEANNLARMPDWDDDEGEANVEQPAWLRHLTHDCDCKKWLYVEFPQVSSPFLLSIVIRLLGTRRHDLSALPTDRRKFGCSQYSRGGNLRLLHSKPDAQSRRADRISPKTGKLHDGSGSMDVGLVAEDHPISVCRAQTEEEQTRIRGR